MTSVTNSTSSNKIQQQPTLNNDVDNQSPIKETPAVNYITNSQVTLSPVNTNLDSANKIKPTHQLTQNYTANQPATDSKAEANQPVTEPKDEASQITTSTTTEVSIANKVLSCLGKCLKFILSLVFLLPVLVVIFLLAILYNVDQFVECTLNKKTDDVSDISINIENKVNTENHKNADTNEITTDDIEIIKKPEKTEESAAVINTTSTSD